MANYNLDLTLEKAIEEFSRKDPAQMAELSGCKYLAPKSLFEIRYLQETYLVEYPTAKITTEAGEEVNLHLQILLLHYLAKAQGDSIKKEWISFKELPDGFIYIDPFTKRTIKPMLNLFASDLDKFLNAAKQLGAQVEKLGDASVTIEVLPRIPITYVIRQEDEEFPASGNILFDGSAAAYLPTEDYAFLASFVIFKMKELM